MMKKIIKKIWTYIRPFLDWRFLVSYFIPFMLINGWAWIGSILLPIIGPNWFTIAATTWLTWLWLPWTPEKLVTIPIALWIHKLLFGKTNEKMQLMLEEAKCDWNKIKNNLKRGKKMK